MSDNASTGWIDTAWPMMGSASLTLGLIYLLVWLRRRDGAAYLFFFITAIAIALYSIFELRMMRAASPQAYISSVRWAHIPIFIAFLGIVGFVRCYFSTPRMWLGYLACLLRAASLILNFSLAAGINFSAVAAMRPLSLWGGETIFLPVVIPNPWVLVAQSANLLLIAFVADASIALWRRGDREAKRRAVAVGATMVCSLTAGALMAALLNLGLLKVPMLFSVAFLCVVLAMAYELGRDVLLAAELAANLEISQEKLRESEQRLKLTAGAADLALWEWDVAADRVWLTGEGRALFGYGPDEPVTLESFVRSLHPDDQAAMLKAIDASLKRGNEFEQDFRVIKSGAVRWMQSRGRIERDETGAATRMRGVSQDVTERKLAEERFRALVEASPSAMVVVDTDGIIVLANATAESLFGYTKAELLGERIELLIPERFHVDHGTLRQAYQHQPQARGMGIGRDLFARHRDGVEIPVEVGLTPMQNSARRYVLASVVDIRARKEADLEAARQRAEVAHLARVAMLGELSGAIAHELNQPLAAILSNAQAAQRFLARQPVQIDQLHAILGDIVRNDKRAGEVIKRLRSLFRKEDPRYQAIDLNDVVREVFALVRSDLLNRQVAVRTELTAVLPSIFGDRVQLQQVLLNLVINGCDAMARNDKRYLIVRTTAVSGAGVQMSVTDQGTGIPPGELEHVFDPFVTSKPQGMGLGLAVCRSIVSAHHGRLWALNNPQGGATFTMELPATSNTNG